MAMPRSQVVIQKRQAVFVPRILLGWNVQRLRKRCLFSAAMVVVPFQKPGWQQRFARTLELRSAHGGTAQPRWNPFFPVGCEFLSLPESTLRLSAWISQCHKFGPNHRNLSLVVQSALQAHCVLSAWVYLSIYIYICFFKSIYSFIF